MEKEDTTTFLNLNGYVSSVDVNHKEVLNIVSQHLKQLAIIFDHYFPADEDSQHGNLWINNPFIQDINSCNLDAHEKESLIDLGCDSTLLFRFKNESLTTFWISQEDKYTSLGFKALKLLVVFSTSYLCEKSFSALILIKTKQRNRLGAESEQRISETSLTPRFSLLLAEKQQQISH